MAKKLTKSKARKILHDKEVHGHPLTEQQRKFFGAIAGGAKPYKAQAGVKTCPPGFVNIEGKCFDKASDEYKALYKFGIGYMDDEDTLVSSRMELPEVVLKPKSVLDFLDKIDLGTDATYGGGANRYAFDQLGKKHGFIPNVKILKEKEPSQLEKLLFDIFDSSDKKRTLEKTAHYIPFIKTAYVDNIKDYIAELSHHVDPLVDNPGMFLITDLPAIINQQNRYKTKGTSEYRAHEEIQPKLKKDFEKYKREYWDNVFRPRYMDTNDPLLRQERMDRVWDNYVSPVKKKKDGGWLDKYVPKAQNGIEGTMGGLTDAGFNYNGAWGGTMQMGGSLPGAVGFTYARTVGAAPANGPYAKKTKASAQDGEKVAKEWLKNWYEERKALPEFEKIAGKRVEALEKIPAVQLEPAPEMRKKGMLAAYVPAKKSIIAADPSTMMEGYDPELGVSPYVLGHEMIHALDYTAPQSGRDVPSYPKVDFVSEKASGMSKPEYSWITSGAIPGTKTEVNAVLYGLRQAEGLKGNKPTTPDQMKSIIDKYKNLGEKELNPKTKEGTMNLQIKNLLDVIGNDPEKLSELNNRIVKGKGKTSPTAQNGQEMKYYQEGLDFKPKTISKNGGWLDKYDKAQDGITAYLQDLKEKDKKKQPPPTKKELEKAISKTKPAFATNTREQAVAKADAYWDPIRKRNEADAARRIAEGKAAERTRESVIRGNADVPFTFPTGETKLWKDMDWREKQYVSGKNLGSTLRFNNWTDYINPLAIIGDMGEGLATAPYVARETKSNLPYVFGVGSPLLAGTLGGLGARNTGQFVENVVSPLPISLSSSASLAKPLFRGALDRTLESSRKDFNLGVKLGIKELGNKSKRPFSEIFPITKAQRQKAADAAKQAHAEGDAFARSWFYDPAGNIRPDVEGKIIDILGSKGSPLENSRYYPNYKTLNDLRYTINTPTGPSYFFTQNPVGETKSVLLGSGIKSINKASGNTAFAPQNWKYPLTANRNLYPLDPSEAKYLLEQRHTLGGVNFGEAAYAGPSVTLMGHGPFYYHPYSIRHLASHEMGHTLQNIGGTMADPAGIPGGFTSWSEVITSRGEPSGYDYYIPNYNTELGKRFGDAMVPPIKGKRVWEASPAEVHSDLMGARANVHKELMDRGMSFEDAMQAIKNQTMTDDAMVDKLIKTGNLNKFFKPNTPIEEKRALIRMLPATITGLGAASAIGASSQEVPQQQDGGEIPVDPMGYWNPENIGNPVTIPSNIITMEGVDQPLLGISDTGDVQYMEPGEDYEFDGEYVTEYPVAKGGVSVNNADAQPLKKLDQLLNFTNYNKPTKGGWLDKYQ